jgi:hypothetical protein
MVIRHMISVAMAVLLAGTALGTPSPTLTIDAGALSMTVPDRGIGVQASALLSDGTELSVRVEHSVSGSITIDTSTSDQPDGAQAAPAGAVRPCADRAYKLTGQRWRETYRWSFRAVSTPTNLSRGRVRAALRRSATNITGAHNSCGRNDRVNADHEFAGVTRRRRPNITATGCNSDARDGVNVVGFRNLPTGVVGLTCWWYYTKSGETIEADMALNRGDFLWRIGRKGCTVEYLVEAVATHEFGHVFGLGHVGERRHPMLTMSERGYPCDSTPSTLGLGDVRGLEALY